jgi:hypothetical protein
MEPPPQGGGFLLAGSSEVFSRLAVSVDDSVHQRARLRAAERNTSLSALVKGFLEDRAGEESEAQRHRRLQNQLLQPLDALHQRGSRSQRA